MAAADAEKKKKPVAPTSADVARRGAINSGGFEGEQARAQAAREKATGAAAAQERAANEGSYAGLGLADRAAAERLIRSGEAKTQDEAAGIIKKRKAKPTTAGAQAKALEKP